VKANPVTLLADATRGLLVGGPVAEPAMKSLIWALGIAVVFAPLAVARFKRRV
jgi:oleandomycin transport system permease protein